MILFIAPLGLPVFGIQYLNSKGITDITLSPVGATAA